MGSRRVECEIGSRLSDDDMPPEFRLSGTINHCAGGSEFLQQSSCITSTDFIRQSANRSERTGQTEDVTQCLIEMNSIPLKTNETNGGGGGGGGRGRGLEMKRFHPTKFIIKKLNIIFQTWPLMWLTPSPRVNIRLHTNGRRHLSSASSSFSVQ